MKNSPPKLSILVILSNESEIKKFNNFSKLFQKDCVKFIIYSNGIEAAEVFQDSLFGKNKFNLILIDLNSNFIDGLETAQIIRNIERSLFWNSTFLCGFVSKVTEEIISKCKTYEINQCIEEPLTKEKLENIMVNLFPV